MIVVIGAGGWGTTLANLLTEKKLLLVGLIIGLIVLAEVQLEFMLTTKLELHRYLKWLKRREILAI